MSQYGFIFEGTKDQAKFFFQKYQEWRANPSVQTAGVILDNIYLTGNHSALYTLDDQMGTGIGDDRPDFWHDIVRIVSIGVRCKNVEVVASLAQRLMGMTREYFDQLWSLILSDGIISRNMDGYWVNTEDEARRIKDAKAKKARRFYAIIAEGEPAYKLPGLTYSFDRAKRLADEAKGSGSCTAAKVMEATSRISAEFYGEQEGVLVYVA